MNEIASTDHPQSETSTRRLPWRRVLIWTLPLLVLFVAAPFIQLWIDTIPRYEQRPSVPLVASPLTGDTTHIWLGDGQFVGAALNKDDYDQYVEMLGEGDEDGIQEMYEDGKMLKLMDGTALAVLERGVEVSKVRVESGRHQGQTCWLANGMVR